MEIIKVMEIERVYKNNGMHLEQSLAYTLTGKIRKHDRVAYDKSSDIPEYDMSVKSAKFTLMSGSICKAQDFEGIIEEYFANTASKRIAYVTQDMNAYIMDMVEFNEFLHLFAFLERESSQNGGRYKVKMRSESKKVIAWLAAKIAAQGLTGCWKCDILYIEINNKRGK